MQRLAIATLATICVTGLAVAQTTPPAADRPAGAGGAANNKEPTNSPGTSKSPSPAAPSMSPSRGANESGAKSSGASGTATGAGGAGALESGANSFTESQAMSRFTDAGFKNVTGLNKDDQGIWRGKAEKDGKSVNVGLDYKGNISAQ